MHANYRDGSHRTIRCTPTTTCGEILTKLLHKLGLSDRAEEYALQIKYTFAGKVTMLILLMLVD